ncbi:hypothetical protein BG004_002777, partial [Podila humilis]
MALALGTRPFYLVLTLFLFSQVITSLWPKHYLHDHQLQIQQQHRNSLLPSWLHKRSFDDSDIKCQDVRAHPDRCAFVETYCSDYPAGLINYLHFYFCDLAHLPSLAVVLLTTWMIFLFGFVGVAASDFFCVTFLAFGNGSPDVFSTFSAMGAGSASLAIGELVGAASFITSVVVGSMAIIKPFKVSRAPFLRDVIFFVGCVLFTLYTVIDGQITLFESITLVVYYFVYVGFVVIGNWYHERVKRERELEAHARNLYDNDDDNEDANDLSPLDFVDNEEQGLLGNASVSRRHSNKPPRISTLPVAGPYDAYDDEEDDLEELDDGYISPGQISANEQQQPLQLDSNQALFNDVVRSLSLSGSRGRIASYDTSYYGIKSPGHSKRHSNRPASSHAHTSRTASVMSNRSQQEPDGPSSSSLAPVAAAGLVPDHDNIMSTSPMSMDQESDDLFDQSFLRHSLILPDHHSPDNQHLGHIHRPQQEQGTDNTKTVWSWKRFTEVMKAIQPIYFPTLLDWDEKTPFIKFLAVTSIPMVFLLTLTLPVVELKDPDEEDEDEESDRSSTVGTSTAAPDVVRPKIVVVGEMD